MPTIRISQVPIPQPVAPDLSNLGSGQVVAQAAVGLGRAITGLAEDAEARREKQERQSEIARNERDRDAERIRKEEARRRFVQIAPFASRASDNALESLTRLSPEERQRIVSEEGPDGLVRRAREDFDERVAFARDRAGADNETEIVGLIAEQEQRFLDSSLKKVETILKQDDDDRRSSVVRGVYASVNEAAASGNLSPELILDASSSLVSAYQTADEETKQRGVEATRQLVTDLFVKGLSLENKRFRDALDDPQNREALGLGVDDFKRVREAIDNRAQGAADAGVNAILQALGRASKFTDDQKMRAVKGEGDLATVAAEQAQSLTALQEKLDEYKDSASPVLYDIAREAVDSAAVVAQKQLGDLQTGLELMKEVATANTERRLAMERAEVDRNRDKSEAEVLERLNEALNKNSRIIDADERPIVEQVAKYRALRPDFSGAELVEDVTSMGFLPYAYAQKIVAWQASNDTGQILQAANAVQKLMDDPVTRQTLSLLATNDKDMDSLSGLLLAAQSPGNAAEVLARQVERASSPDPIARAPLNAEQIKAAEAALQSQFGADLPQELRDEFYAAKADNPRRDDGVITAHLENSWGKTRIGRGGVVRNPIDKTYNIDVILGIIRSTVNGRVKDADFRKIERTLELQEIPQGPGAGSARKFLLMKNDGLNRNAILGDNGREIIVEVSPRSVAREKFSRKSDLERLIQESRRERKLQ